jgi:hypothetical protein
MLLPALSDLADISSLHRKGQEKGGQDYCSVKGGQAASSQIGTEDLRAALDKVKAEEVPRHPEQKEQYFMSQVSMGEQICTQGCLICFIQVFDRSDSCLLDRTSI